MRKIVAVLLAALLLLTQVFAAAEESGAEQTEYTRLVVGHTTQMKGDFFTGMWGNATSDIDVRSLVHGYYLTMWGYETGLFVHTPNVVSGMLIAEDPEGMHIPLFLIHPDGSEPGLRQIFPAAEILPVILFHTHPVSPPCGTML